ncbi:Hint domain-containing protein [Bordetella sp. BOR01]|uniref:Hint domain-containing protein n=1 Tax=Bordetella sp. BOR01 TaxID=2854779 RepID=UPI001C47B49F|nr:Hint domain-containing protein [Bordetella sp. BOR01]MBV7483287.1 Hint domain-containing protein [Bordetella sp. BOR01]
MATEAVIHVGGINPHDVLVDMDQYDADTELNAFYHDSNTTLNVGNMTDLPYTLDVKQTIDAILSSTFSLNVLDNASVRLVGLDGSANNPTYNYGLVGNGKLEMTEQFVDTALGYLGQAPVVTINVDFSDAGASTLVYDPGNIAYDLRVPPNITGMSMGDQIQVPGAQNVNYENNVLIFRTDQGLEVGRLHAPDLDPDWLKMDGDTMTYACYLKGTHIATPGGETKIEDLAAGDQVCTASGGVATVKWLGYRTLHKHRIPAKNAIRAFPILFKQGAIADNVPHRDLLLSPGHHVYFDGALIPAMLLVNGRTVIQQFDVPVFEYFHVELEQFDILLAEGLPAESYVDTGNRAMFQNADTVVLHPDFGPSTGRPVIDGIKVLRAGPTVEAVRKRLLARAQTLTQSVRITDPGLYIEIDGQQIYAQQAGQHEGVLRFALPTGATHGDLRIRSRFAVVRETTARANRDLRQVGVGLVRITIEDEIGRRDLDLLDTRLDGMHAPQDVYGAVMRWTNGDARIPAALHCARGQAVLELHVLRTYSYWEKERRVA